MHAISFVGGIADAQLHRVLAEMTQGPDAVRGKGKKVNRRAGLEKFVASAGAMAC